MNIKIVLVILTIVVLGAGVYHFTFHDQLADKIQESQDAQSKAADHIYSDYGKSVKSKPAPMPGQ